MTARPNPEPSRAAARMPDRPPLDGLEGRRILVLEDEYLIALDMSATLESCGADVVGPFARIEEALGWIERGEALDAAILDLDLRGGRSYPVADALDRRGIPFVFTTGFSVEAIDAAYRHHPRCTKPVDRRALMQALAAPAS